MKIHSKCCAVLFAAFCFLTNAHTVFAKSDISASPIAIPSDTAPNFVTVLAQPIDIQEADRILKARTPRSPNTSISRKIASSTTVMSVGCATGVQPKEIVTLAASLKCDPDLIFEYVYNNIEYEPLYGSNKGALGALLDQRGNDIDQAQLFVALLNAAGVTTPPVFFYGYIRLTGAQATSWLGVKNDALAIEYLLGNGGIPISDFSQNSDGTLNYIDIAHVWVQVQINGTNYQFDPSFKLHTVTAGLGNLATILNYNQTSFLADAGGTANTVSITGLNRANIRNDLAAYANNLVNYIKTNHPAWTVADVLGGKTIQPLTGSPLRQLTVPNLAPQPSSNYPTNWGATVPDAYRTCFTVSMPNIPVFYCGNGVGSGVIQLYTDETYGHRITVFSVPSGSNYIPTLLIDGALPPNGTNTGPATAGGTTWNVGVAILHPYASSSLASANQIKVLAIKAGGSYLIGAGWGQVNRGMVEKHRALLSQAIAAGNAPDSEVVLGESLAVISYSWLAEGAALQRISDGVTKITTQYHHGVGITAQTVIQGTSVQGPYVDLPMNFLTEIPQTSGVLCPLPVNYLGAFFTQSGMASSLESAVLEQTQANVAGIQAASTVRLVDMNAGTGAATYFADGTSAAGVANYFSSIRPNLTSTYAASDLTTIDNKISSNGTSTGSPAGNQVLLPANGQINVGTAPWKGAGYSIISESCNSLSVAQQISGGLNGGFSGSNIPSPILIASTQTQMQPASANPAVPAAALAKAPAAADPVIAEPVDAITGAYIYQHDDLITGSGKFPYALPFSRTYTSSANTSDIGLGNGWFHNYSLTASRSSDPYAGLGESSPISAAAAIAAVYVSVDLLGSPLGAKNLTIAWMTNGWLTDQLTNNSVLISSPGTSEEYTMLPHTDGSSTATYNPPMGSAVVLTGTAPDTQGNFTTFNYVNKDKTQLAFNSLAAAPAGKISTWTFPNGMHVNFAYGYAYGGQTYLTSVTNNFGRSLTLGYSGAHLNTITDDTGRSAAFSYDNSNNLAGFTDPLRYQTRFAYDGAAGHLTQIFYPSNPNIAFVSNVYDLLGRVFQQSNANGNTTNFYIGGTRTETIDPAGDRHVTYQTSRGKVLKDDTVLSNTFGNVFNDTVQSNGAINVASNQYDGLDRLILAVAPEGGTTALTYSPDLSNNVIQTTRVAKPGSPLLPLTTTYSYDPVYNQPTTITDALGRLATNTYDGATGNLLTSVADAGPGHFNATTQFSYSNIGQVLAATDPRGTVIRFVYDGLGNPISVTRDYGGLNQITGMTYSPLGDVTSTTDPNRNVTAATYDANRRQTSNTTPTTTSTPALTTALDYDPDGRVLQTRQSAGGVLLRATSTAYTPTGEPATSTDANGNVTRSAYDVVDRLSSMTDPVGSVTSFGYDAMSRRIAVFNTAIQSMPLAQTTYSPDGLKVALIDAAGHVTAYAYDGFDRLGATTYPDASTEAYTYDANANPLTRKTRKGDIIVLTYDTLNRLSTKTPPSPAPVVTYGYDLVGHVTSISDNSPAIISPVGTASYVSTASYDALNRPINVVWSPAPPQTPGSTSGVNFTRTYDAANRMIGQAVSDKTWLLHPAGASSVNYTANNLNQYSQIGAVTPTYDGNGNLTYDGTFTYRYDSENRLIGINNGAAVVANYAFDGQGRRKSKTVNGVTTIYVTDTDNREVLEYDGVSGAQQKWYAYGTGVDDVLNQMNITAATRATMVPDAQGSILATLDSGTGGLNVAGYLPYGENPGNYAGSYRYTGRRIDPETGGSSAEPSGLYYYRARMYSPTLGRFLQADPSGYADGANLYEYVHSDPLNWIDPYGLSADGPGAIISSWWNASVSGYRSDSGVDTALKVLQGFGPESEAMLGAVVGITKALTAAKTAEGAATEISFGVKATRNSAPSINVNLTQSEAIENLAANSYSKALSKDGTVTIMSNGDKTYRFYPQSTGGGVPGATSGVPSASVSVMDKIISKLRFRGE